MAENKNKIPLIVVVGPTASGKTALGVALSKKLDGEVVSADSMQIYKGMDIATAKPSEEEMCGVPHHLISCIGQEEPYSAAEFVEQAKPIIPDIYARGRQPVLVGGTGLYVNSLIDNIKFIEHSYHPEIRETLNQRMEHEGVKPLLDELMKIDPEYAVKLHPNNTKRVVRALEIYYNTGVTMSEQLRQSRLHESDYLLFMLGIKFEQRQLLYDRINKRVDIMIENGLLKEAENAANPELCKTSVQAIGHKELLPYFKGNITLDEAVENLKKETRHYAKRQMTWFSRDERINWITADGSSKENILQDAINLLEKNGYYDIIRQAGSGLSRFAVEM